MNQHIDRSINGVELTVALSPPPHPHAIIEVKFSIPPLPSMQGTMWTLSEMEWYWSVQTEHSCSPWMKDQDLGWGELSEVYLRCVSLLFLPL